MFRLTILAAIGVVAGAMFAPVPVLAAHKPSHYNGVLSFTMKNIEGKEVPLSRYRGKVLLIVNTASLCGHTPQYASLETLYKKYRRQGLRILAFPANNFAHQEPGNNSSIKAFCTSKYKVTFDLFSKISVKGEDEAPLYSYLTDKKTDPNFGGEIAWNFTKFLISRKGDVVGRFEPGVDPLAPEVVLAIKNELTRGTGAR